MKKIYMKPETETVNIKMQQHLLGISGGEPHDEKVDGPDYSRGGRGFWDDEEDF